VRNFEEFVYYKHESNRMARKFRIQINHFLLHSTFQHTSAVTVIISPLALSNVISNVLPKSTISTTNYSRKRNTVYDLHSKIETYKDEHIVYWFD